ncbi:cadherin-like beta sandwich domain-containing protein [Clostridium sp. BL-8]|uniref:cadherin-like beta sandwich domain-containing protein n=1 Tax=Clostridium sp. BL-8 TaxID=349938 RepID=UPI00098C2FD6|nr:cadherin-like beta sandwich domain-containing protein [Clostridium sp. BL-8]OOM71285.1 autolysin [Clostridium sp. BL-8]
MNKQIKRIIAVALAISAFSVLEPAKYLSLTNTKAYARVTGADLDKISLGDGSINFKSSVTDYTLQLDMSIDELRVTATPEEDTAEVEINGKDVTDSDYRTVVDLDKGENTITIDVKNGSKKKTYTIKVMRGHAVDDEIYLSDIKLSAGNISFSKDQTEYNVDVPSDTSDISVKATPEDTDYDEEIDKITATDDDNYKRTVNLAYGNNDVTIRIRDDDDHEKIYTLHINREKTNAQAQTSTTATANQNAANGNSTADVTAKGWVLNNGQWSYINDKGSKDIGWKQINGVWYYLGNDGAMKIGWQNVNGDWYYLNNNGTMKTGWIENSDGKWYYLLSSGVMAKNTTIDGYKLDANGAWVK